MLGLLTELIVKPIKCAATGEKVNIDVAAVVNPLRAVHNTVQMVQSSVADKSSHVWVGRRCLGDGNFLGLSFSPGADVYHWAIAIEGFIYEIDVHATNSWHISRNERVESDSGKSFEWFRINEGAVVSSRRSLTSYADSMEGQGYGHGLGTQRDAKNCQEFCIALLARAMGVSQDRACAMIAGHVGTILW